MSNAKPKITVIDTAKTKLSFGQTRWGRLLQEARLEQQNLTADSSTSNESKKPK